MGFAALLPWRAIEQQEEGVFGDRLLTPWQKINPAAVLLKYRKKQFLTSRNEKKNEHNMFQKKK